ncbi:hypothetical protein NL108_010664 [Boleophthalmus pectinirostris]|uniref:protein Z-dependent protease inhibitor n=1 Tax=Boleophthalmus pectinirostris TaxID=150288 RepID=UPI000A1C6FE5|nr:protein Z-dependent protease inhibitor [Boleophthalmus pectinirostris]KAJ0044212.1 hypothetical protein NL108_010664 [Boleophthalmus pectinirostris]
MDHLFRMNWLFYLTFLCCFASVFQDTLPNPNITDLSHKNMDFAVNLYRRISSYHDKNIFFSPLSISTSFAALLMATGGVTRDEILNGLNWQQLDRANEPEIIPQLFHLLYKNITQNGSLSLDQDMAMFVSDKLSMEKTFEEQMEKYFEADIKAVDFSDMRQSVAYINNYIKDKTNDRVQDMISSLDAGTQLMILNTIFFRGNWKSPFNPNFTKTEAFYIDNYHMVNVQMMYKEARFFMGHDQALRVKVLKIPYEHDVSLLIVLPNEGVDYTAIDDEINADRFQEWLQSLRPLKVEVHLPKFKLEQSYELHNLLPNLGVNILFTDSANLTKLHKDQDMKVSEVLHKAVIDVDETGTTAAAATTIGIIPYSLPPSFIANRPFFFFIYHEDTNTLLFMGRLIDPTKV